MYNLVSELDIEAIMFDLSGAGVGYTDARELELFELFRLNARLSLRYQKQADAIKKSRRGRK